MMENGNEMDALQETAGKKKKNERVFSFEAAKFHLFCFQSISLEASRVAWCVYMCVLFVCEAD